MKAWLTQWESYMHWNNFILHVLGEKLKDDAFLQTIKKDNRKLYLYLSQFKSPRDTRQILVEKCKVMEEETESLARYYLKRKSDAYDDKEIEHIVRIIQLIADYSEMPSKAAHQCGKGS